MDGAGLGRRPADEVDDEIRFHLEARAEQLEAEGLSPDEARTRALEEFGPLDDARTEMLRRTRRSRRRRGLTDLGREWLQDLRFGLRSARSRPGPTGVAVLSIALGMAAVTTMWTTLDRLILRPLPFDPDRTMVYVGWSERGRGGPSLPMAPGDFLDLRDASRTVALTAYREGGASLGGEVPEWVQLRHVVPGFFDVVGVLPAMGRSFRADDARPDAEVALLDHGLWERRFGSDPGILGHTIRLDGRPLTVVGVLPERFELGHRDADVWLPLHLEDDGVRRARTVNVIGRMRGDLASTRGELAERARRLAERFPATHAERTFPANTMVAELSAGPVVAQGLGVSLAAALFVLLIACANVANLLLARGADRAGEIALRRALGAGRGRILRQLLVESLLLAAVGGALGVALSVVGIRALASLTPPDMARTNELVLDPQNALVGMGIALASVLLFGLLPALRTLAAGERKGLVSGTRGTAARQGHRLRAILVAGEVALAVVLVTTTGLLVRSFEGIRAVETGFETAGVWTLRTTLPEVAYPDDAAVAAGIERARDAVSGVPGIREVGLGVAMPGGGWRSLTYRPPGGDAEARAAVLARLADPSYFRILGLEPLRGRGLAADDDATSAPVALVNESFAAELWDDDDPVGRTLEVMDRTLEIVGVFPNVREVGPMAEPWPALYAPLAQWPSRPLTMLFRTAGGEPPVAGIRQALADLDGEIAVREVRTLESVLIQSAEGVQALSRVLGTMAAAALFLALIGVYAATSYSVACRVPEIGVRMALGADASSVRARVLRRALLVSGIGLAVGLPMAWGAGKGLSRYIFGTAGSAPGTYLGVAAGLLAVAATAAWLPARRASGIDPIRALRAE